MTTPQLTVYVRLYCGLCEDLVAQLAALRGELGFEYRVLDVDEDPALRARYHDLVPVLTAGDTEICHHFFDAKALRRYLAHA